MKHERLYILPTRHGLAFLVALFFLFLMALSYGHSMAFAATFFLISLLMSSALLTHFNLRECSIKNMQLPAIIRAGPPLNVSVEWENLTKRNKISISLYKLGPYKFTVGEGVDIRPFETMKASLPLQNLPIGHHTYSHIQLGTSFPLGLFYSWVNIPKTGSFYVAPPAINHMHQEPETSSTNSLELQQGLVLRMPLSTEGDFYEHGHFDVQSDSWHRLDWKVFAKKGQLLKKINASPVTPVWSLDIHRLQHLTLDQAYQQISYWLELCERNGHRFHMVLKTMRLNDLEGRQGVQKALKSLSLEAAFSEKS